MIYLDNNASTPVDPEVADEMMSAVRTCFGNSSSSHYYGLYAKACMEKARSRVAGLIGTSPEEIYFTSGGTESNNLAIAGTARRHESGHIITSQIEHPSVLNPCRYLEALGFDVTYAGVDRQGRVSPEEIEKAVRKDTILITIMHANNETGVLQPVEEIGEIAKKQKIAFHSDAAQTAGKIQVDVNRLNAGMLTLVPHKFYGPKGIGALYVKKGTGLNPIMFGAGHEAGLRPGTENVPGIAGFGKACELAGMHIDDRIMHQRKLTEMLFSGLKRNIPGIRLNGDNALRLPNTLNMCIPGADISELLMLINDKVAASAGSACHSGSRKPSPVLAAMGLSCAEALSSVRFSTGIYNTPEEIRESADIISAAFRKIKNQTCPK